MRDPYVADFAKKHGLSNRETEIVELLTKKIISLKSLADYLKISPSTINNHLNHIYEKTGTHSKAELLAHFINSATDKFKFFKVPRVLVVDDEPYICENLEEALIDRGLRVYTTTDPLQAIDIIAMNAIDFVVCDIRMPELDGFSLLERIREKYPFHPVVLFITAYAASLDEKTLQNGVAEIIEKPVDHELLYLKLMSHWVENVYERNRFLRVPTDLQAEIDVDQDYRLGNIGIGGLFLRVPKSKLQTDDRFISGKAVRLKFRVDPLSDPIRVVGQIVWRREEALDNLDTGVGIKFIEISDPDLHQIKKFVQLNKILSFIPIGAPPYVGTSTLKRSARDT